MAKHQPEPFEFKRGMLLDNTGKPVDLKNPANLALIGQAFTQLYATHKWIVAEFDDLKEEFKNGPKVVESLAYSQEMYYEKPL